jgi:hypothetical protein
MSFRLEFRTIFALMDLEKIIIEPHYFPCINFFSLLMESKEVVLNDEIVFRKQSYKNRCLISSANKVLPLIVPVKKGKSKLKYKDVELDYSSNWQKLHWTSIVSAYNSSPFFFHYRDYFESFFEERHTSLFEMNMSIINVILEILNIEVSISFLSVNKTTDTTDLTNAIHPKTNFKNLYFNETEYYQVFSEKFGFIKNLSILDLIFNEGPQAKLILMNNSIKIQG